MANVNTAPTQPKLIDRLSDLRGRCETIKGNLDYTENTARSIRSKIFRPEVCKEAGVEPKMGTAKNMEEDSIEKLIFDLENMTYAIYNQTNDINGDMTDIRDKI